MLWRCGNVVRLSVSVHVDTTICNELSWNTLRWPRAYLIWTGDEQIVKHTCRGMHNFFVRPRDRRESFEMIDLIVRSFPNKPHVLSPPANHARKAPRRAFLHDHLSKVLEIQMMEC